MSVSCRLRAHGASFDRVVSEPAQSPRAVRARAGGAAVTLASALRLLGRARVSESEYEHEPAVQCVRKFVRRSGLVYGARSALGSAGHSNGDMYEGHTDLVSVATPRLRFLALTAPGAENARLRFLWWEVLNTRPRL